MSEGARRDDARDQADRSLAEQAGDSTDRVISEVTPLVELKDVRFERDGRVILDGIDFSIAPGEIVTLIGPNGGGKTTFARLCLGVLSPSSGVIKRQRGLSVGYVPQRLKMDRSLPLTVGRFLTIRQAAAKRHVETALNDVGAGHLIRSQMAALSGGELQRVLLARALLSRPTLLVLDEPAQGVDFAGEAALYELISKLRERLNCAVLLISHDLHIVMGSSDRVLCLNGHICCAGVPEQISQHPEYARLFGAEKAATFAIYQHDHDHEHALSGDVCCGHEHGHEGPETGSGNGPTGAKGPAAHG